MPHFLEAMKAVREMGHPGSAARDSPKPGSTSTVDLCTQGNPCTCGTIVDTVGPKEIHNKRAQRVFMHTQYEIIHPREMGRNVQDGFLILLTVTNVVRVSWDRLKLSCIMAIPQEHRRPRLKLNLLDQPNEGASSINDTTERDVAPDLMHFWRTFPRIIQTIWEADPDKGLVWVSKLDMKYEYHRITIQPSQVGSFDYGIPLAAN